MSFAPGTPEATEQHNARVVGTLTASLDKLLVLSAHALNGRELSEAIGVCKALIAGHGLEVFGDGVVSADSCWEPFRIALAAGQPLKVRETALDALQKLIAHRALRGAVRGTLGSSRRGSFANGPTGLGVTSGPSATAPNATPSATQNASMLSSVFSLFGRGAADASQQNEAGDALPSPTLPKDEKPNDLSAIDVSSPRSSSPIPTSATTTTPSHSHPPFLIDDIVHAVCTSFSNANPDDAPVQLQVLKVLLTAVTSTNTCQVHAASLLKAVQTCFNIYLHSKNVPNAVTAKAALTQMVHAVFSRMERYADVLEKNALLVHASADTETLALGGTTSASLHSDGNISVLNLANPLPVVSTEESNADHDFVVAVTADSSDPEPLKTPSILMAPLPSVESLKPNGNVVGMFDDDMSGAGSTADSLDDVDSEPAPVPTEPPKLSPPRPQPHQLHQSELTSPELAPHVLSPPIPPTATTTPNPTPSSTPNDPTIAYYNTLLKKDAFLVFRLLCRLSSQTDTGISSLAATFTVASVTAAAALPPTDDVSAQTVKARSLALELILSILNNAGHVLQTEDMYAELVKNTLAASISRNAITTNPVLFEFSLSIFLMVIRYYRARMKIEVEVLLNTVYLHILEMGNSTYKQKLMVLQGLQKILSHPPTLADMYLNYDCDLNSISLFERVLSVCTRVAQGKEDKMKDAPLTLLGLVGSATGFGGEARGEVVRREEGKLKVGGAVCLVAVVGSLVVWGSGEGGEGGDGGGEESGSGSEGEGEREGGEREEGVGECGESVVTSPVGVVEHGNDGGLSPAVRNGSLSTLGTAVGGAPSSPIRRVATPQLLNAAVGTTNSAIGSPTAAKLLLDALASDSPVVLNKNRLQNVTISQKPVSAKGDGHHHHHHLHHSHLTAGGTVTPIASSERGGSVTEDEAGASQKAAIEAIALRKSLMKQGLKLFEEKPIKGIAFFKKNGFIPALEYDGPSTSATAGHASNSANGDGVEPVVVDTAAEDNEAFSIACFLKSMSGLNKGAIGSYLGEGDAFYIKVMHMFVDMMDFEGTGIVEALRTFLQTFRLPGEAQKIDRLMEKFADRFCETNPEVFAKADTAYILAFSIIMLNKDAHSTQIKNKMTKPGFLRNNRGIIDNGDLPDEYLEAIYDNILNNEIIMEDEQTGKFAQMVQGWGTSELSDKDRMELYRKEVAQIQKKSQQLLASSGTEQNLAPWKTATQPDLARLMFATACWPLIATFSQLFESFTDDDVTAEAAVAAAGLMEKEDMDVIDLCLEGFANGIKIASLFKMEMEREAFVTSLSKLTGLSHFRDFKPKNIKAIRTLLGLTLSFAEHLDSSWTHVIKVISQMERLQLLGGRGASFDSNRMEDLRSNPHVEKLLSEFSSQETVVAVDRIFTGTMSMSGPSILQFFRAVCAVSLEEVGIDPISVTRMVQSQGSPVLESSALVTPMLSSAQGMAASKSTTGIVTMTKADGPPRMYLLQKIVEIAHYNMHRIRYEWSQIWRVLQPHFIVVGCHPNVRVASFAVDALRQLSMKFLEREELVHFSTQNEFLKSFERIMKLTTDDTIRHMIVGSLGQMISARAGSIRSGWKPIFVVLSRPAFMVSTSSNEMDDLLLESFQLVQTIFKEHFSIVVHAGGLVDFINCVADFALLDALRQSHEEIVLSSIQLLQLCASQMIHSVEDEIMQMKLKGVNPPSLSLPSTSSGKLVLQTANLAHPPTNRTTSQPLLMSSGVISEEHFFLKWFPIFSALSRITMGSNNLAVRTKCIEALFEVLSQCIHMFDLKCVRSIYRSAILPIFDDLKEQFDKHESGDDSASVSGSVAEAGPKQGSATIWILGLRLTIDLFSENFMKIAGDPATISSILDIALSMMKRRNQTLVATGQICLHQFIQQNVGKFSEAGCWTTIVDSIEKAFCMTNPYELVNCDFSSMKHLPDPPPSMIMNVAALGSISTNAPEILAAVVAEGTATAQKHGAFVSLESLNFNQTILKCSVHIELLQSIRDSVLASVPVVGEPDKMLAVSGIPAVDRVRLLACIRDSYTVSRCFNANYHLRYSIWKKRLVQQLPNLIKQETISIASHVKVLFAIYRAEGDPEETVVERTEEEKEWARQNVDMLVTETVDLMERYVMMLGDAQVNATNIGLWSPVVVLVFRELLAMDCWWKSNASSLSVSKEGPKCLGLKKQLPRLFRLGIRMMGVDRVDVRQALQGFIEKVGEELFFDMF
ncbi:Brefeldin A-inhibited guanine nucleotide-exchange protein 2 [Podochytrium sp. JEL0797]|nr:Brefeldin A-inhibited guanine nucleotide-exchange protein 2 [Podochytrium sp. JEL0797]